MFSKERFNKILTVFISLILLLTTVTPAAAEDDWLEIVPGIYYQSFSLVNSDGEPQRIYVARMSRSSEYASSLTLETSIAQRYINRGLERVEGMANRYEDTLNYWYSPVITGTPTWGNRNDVVVAINGSFFNKDTYVMERGLFHSGWYAKRFTDFENGSGFFWTLDREAVIGECIKHVVEKQVVVLDPGGINSLQYFQGINRERKDNELIIYSPQWDLSTPEQDKFGVEVIVELNQPLLLMPVNDNGTSAGGRIIEIRQNTKGDSLIPFDGIVLSAHGTAAEALLGAAQVGMSIGVNQELKNYEESDCSTPLNSIDWTKTYAGLGGSYHFLENGVIKQFDDAGAIVKDPRTAIAFNDDYIYFIVVDGRRPGYSVGMTIDELAVFASETLTATHGINQDGGGSSTMWVNGARVNYPSDAEACFSLYIPFSTRSPLLPASLAPTGTDTVTEYLGCERYVDNGLMMVQVQAREVSTMTIPMTQTLIVSNTAFLRQGPGYNYAAYYSLDPGETGNVITHTLGMNGIRASGMYWWKVKFGDKIGWVEETQLAPFYPPEQIATPRVNMRNPMGETIR